MPLMRYTVMLLMAIVGSCYIFLRDKALDDLSRDCHELRIRGLIAFQESSLYPLPDFCAS